MKSEREYYLDWLRVMVVLLLVPHHTAVTFSHIGNGYIYTEQAVDSLYYTLQSDFLNLWFMKLLFFISGISSYMALKKRSPREYLKERFHKLFIPAAFVTLLLGPLTAYIVAYSEGYFPGSLLDFYPLYLRNISEYLGWAQMWFCVYLFVFSILLLPIFLHIKNRPANIRWINFFVELRYNYLFPMLFIILLN